MSIKKLFLIILFTSNSFISCFGQSSILPKVIEAKDTLAMSLINSLWEEDYCANKGIRQAIGFFVIENKVAFIGKTKSEISMAFGKPEWEGDYTGFDNKKVEGATEYIYTASGDICKPGEPIVDFDIWFIFRDEKLIDIGGAYY